MSTKESAQPVEVLKEWLLARDPELIDLTEDTPLLDSVLVDSMHFVEMLVFLEDIRGEPISAEEMQLDTFRTLRMIVDTFFGQPVTEGHVVVDG